MNATESLLALLRAARDFTRRAVDAEALERAAIAHAEARGWVPRRSATPLAYAGTDRDDHPLLIKMARICAGPVGDGKMARLRETALRYAEARGWRAPDSAGAERTLTTGFARGLTQAGARIAELEGALRGLADRLDATDGQPNAWVVREVVEHARKVLG